MKIDCHVHTICSKETDLSLDRIEMMCKKKKIEGLIIADHNEIDCAKLAQKKFKQIKVIVAEEITTSRGEVIGLFLTEKIQSHLSPGQTMDLIHAQGGLVCVPHPFDRSTGRRNALKYNDCLMLKDKIDIVEIFNSRTFLNYYNRKSLEFAKKFNKLMSVGSDAHTKLEIGNAYAEMEDFNSKEEFVMNLKRATFIKRKSSFWFYLITFFTRLKNKYFKK